MLDVAYTLQSELLKNYIKLQLCRLLLAASLLGLTAFAYIWCSHEWFA